MRYPSRGRTARRSRWCSPPAAASTHSPAPAPPRRRRPAPRPRRMTRSWAPVSWNGSCERKGWTRWLSLEQVGAVARWLNRSRRVWSLSWKVSSSSSAKNCLAPIVSSTVSGKWRVLSACDRGVSNREGIVSCGALTWSANEWRESQTRVRSQRWVTPWVNR